MLSDRLRWLVVGVALLVLLGVSAVIGYKTYREYKLYSQIETSLVALKAYRSVEHAFLNEVVCRLSIAELSQNPKACQAMRETTEVMMRTIKKSVEQAEWEKLANVIATLRHELDTQGHKALENVVAGVFEKQIGAFSKRRLDAMRRLSESLEYKREAALLNELNRMIFFSELEKALSAYYIGKKIPFKYESSVYWDKLVRASDPARLDAYSDLPLGSAVSSAWRTKEKHALLRKIDTMRIDLIQHMKTGKYATAITSWVEALNRKVSFLTDNEKKVLQSIERKVLQKKRASLYFLWGALVGVLLSLVALFLWVRSVSKEKYTRNFFSRLSGALGELTYFKDNPRYRFSEDSGVELSVVTGGCKDLDRSFQELSAEHKQQKLLLSKALYDMQTPIEAISGYQALLKETALSVEQHEYVRIIEENIRKLKKIASSVEGDRKVYTPFSVFEGEKRKFNLLKKCEEIAEAFANDAAQQDINLTLFVDPLYNKLFLGEEEFLVESLNTSISSALRRSHPYGSVDIVVDAVDRKEYLHTVSFSVVFSGEIFDREELEDFETLSQAEVLDDIPEDKMMSHLLFSNMLLKRMGSRLHLENLDSKRARFTFDLALNEVSQTQKSSPPKVEEIRVGIALPTSTIYRQQEKNIQSYLNSLGLECKFYYYDELFEEKPHSDLPDLLIAYHHYARLEGEIEQFLSLGCKIALITTPTLRSRLDFEKYRFTSIIYEPITYNKILRMLGDYADGQKTGMLDSQGEITERDGGVVQSKTKEFEGLKVLIAEDNHITQKLLREVFEKFGVETTIVSNGQEAFEMRRKKDFDLILMDIDMPTMDGYEATNKILYFEKINKFAHIPIVALVPSAQDEEKYIKYGMDGILLKSLREEEIERVLRRFGIEYTVRKMVGDDDDILDRILSEGFFKDDDND